MSTADDLREWRLGRGISERCEAEYGETSFLEDKADEADMWSMMISARSSTRQDLGLGQKV